MISDFDDSSDLINVYVGCAHKSPALVAEKTRKLHIRRGIS